MTTNHDYSVLAVGVPSLAPVTANLDICVAPSAREAFAMLRLLHFDLLLAGRETLDQPVWWLIERVLRAWPQQRWVFVARDVTFEEEIRARSLGSSLILDAVPNGTALGEIVRTLLGRKLPSTAGWSSMTPGVGGRKADVNSVTTSTS